MRIGLVQLSAASIHCGDVRHYVAYGKAAAAAGCDWIVFPELSDSGYDLEAAQARSPCQQDALADVARSQHLWVFAGGREAGTPQDFNMLQVFAPDGRRLEVYRKIHLFADGAVDEARHFAGGRHPVALHADGVQVGLAICFDLRFPALYRAYALRGVEVLVTVAAWPSVRIADWRLLQQARALENQAFTVGVNYCGGRGGVQFGGCSMVCGPDGKILMEASAEHEVLLTCDVDLEMVRHLRARFPVLKADQNIAWHG